MQSRNRLQAEPCSLAAMQGWHQMQAEIWGETQRVALKAHDAGPGFLLNCTYKAAAVQIQAA